MLTCAKKKLDSGLGDHLCSNTYYYQVLQSTLLFSYSVMSITLCDPTDCSPPGSSVHGISQVSILKQVAISFSTHISCIGRWIPYHGATREALFRSYKQDHYRETTLIPDKKELCLLDSFIKHFATYITYILSFNVQITSQGMYYSPSLNEKVVMTVFIPKMIQQVGIEAGT